MRSVIQLWTDAPQKDCAVNIAVQDPHPQAGDWIEWTTGHVIWKGKKLRKLGYAYSVDDPLH